MRALAGSPLWVRPRASDLVGALHFYYHGAYLPPPGVDGIATICELGANIGAALAALASRFPDARLLGVEPDEQNLEVARLNLAPFAQRCELVQAAIWDSNANLVVDRSSPTGEHGFTVRPRKPEESVAESFPAITVDELLDRHLPGERVDYMHVNIEGSEPRVFASAHSWAERVRSIRVEVHPYFDYSSDDCIAQLTDLGFDAWLVPKPAEKWVLGVRR